MCLVFVLTFQSIIYKLPEEIVNEKIRKKKIEYERKIGKAVSKRLLASLKYAIFITNIPKEKLDSKMIGTLYKMANRIDI